MVSKKEFYIGIFVLVFLWAASFGLLYFYSTKKGDWKYFYSGDDSITALSLDKNRIAHFYSKGQYEVFTLRNIGDNDLHKQSSQGHEDKKVEKSKDYYSENISKNMFFLLKKDEEGAKEMFKYGYVTESEVYAYAAHKTLKEGANLLEVKPKWVKHYFIQGLLDPKEYREYLREMGDKQQGMDRDQKKAPG